VRKLGRGPLWLMSRCASLCRIAARNRTGIPNRENSSESKESFQRPLLFRFTSPCWCKADAFLFRGDVAFCPIVAGPIFGFNEVGAEALGLAAGRNRMRGKLAQCWASQADQRPSMLTDGEQQGEASMSLAISETAAGRIRTHPLPPATFAPRRRMS
jgi:hypothetical protein